MVTTAVAAVSPSPKPTYKPKQKSLGRSAKQQEETHTASEPVAASDGKELEPQEKMSSSPFSALMQVATLARTLRFLEQDTTLVNKLKDGRQGLDAVISMLEDFSAPVSKKQRIL